jgi:Transposase DDE domain
MKWGLELSALGLADIENHTAMHYHATQTQAIKGEESLRSYYAKLLCKQAPELLKTSKTIAFDAFFSKKPFVDSICAVGFTMISRLQWNIYMRYAYVGEQKPKGRKKEYDGKIDPKNISTKHFKIIKSDENEVIYEGIAHVRSLKRWVKIVIVHTLKDGKVHKAFIYFSTDKNAEGLKVLQYYRIRYQIEFLFRDAKNHLGLEDSQSRQETALDFHFNLALTTLNIAKAMHWLSIPKKDRGPFSMADIKTQYVNELLLDRLIFIYGKDPSIEKNNPIIRELYQLGRIAA